MRAYEIVYIFDPALDQAAVDSRLETFHGTLGAEVSAVDHWGVRQLAYPIKKAKSGYFVVAQVNADSAALPEFERLVRLDEQAYRYLVVLNVGQPSSGTSIVRERPPKSIEVEEEDDRDGPKPPPDDDDDDDEGDEEEESADSFPSGPPEFSGAKGRRRRHEGPPIVLLNYKDVTTLARFLTEQGKILPKRTTKVTARFQRQLGTAVKRARYLSLLPYVQDHEA